MITCPQCGAQNLPGLAYCENCGSPLPQQAPAAAPAGLPAQAPLATTGAAAPDLATPSTPAPPDQSVAAAPQPVAPVDQPAPAVGVATHAAADANLVAADSDASAAQPATAAPSVPAPAAPVPSAPTLVITFPSGQSFTMQGSEANVGRTDVAQSWHPELDVIPYGGGAPDLGVSRHQARIVQQDGSFAVIDMGSTNGTYVNGRAASYNQPVPLQDGDTLSFGALNTQVSIK